MKRLALPVSIFAALAVAASVWLPLLSHVHVGVAPTPVEDIMRMSVNPADPLLAELSQFDVAIGIDVEDEVFVELAERVLDNTLDIPGVGVAAISGLFSADDLTGLPGPLQLPYASFVVPYVLVRAYEVSADERFIVAARESVNAWSKFESSPGFPKGFQWNDHAVAARAYVLVRVWRAQRDTAGMEDKVAIVGLANRTAQLLAKPSHYRVATNHGVMQNLALLHLSMAFPEIQGMQNHQELALNRLLGQFEFYLSPEGAVLEHSAGYHEYGLNLLSHFARYLALLDRPVSEDWANRYRNAVAFYKSLLRNDGTLPLIGDTHGPALTIPVVDIETNGEIGPMQALPVLQRSPGATVLPVSGYAVWWDKLTEGGAVRHSQLVSTWSRFPSYAHKHADDMSLTLWRSGGNWITSSGYWSYWSSDRNNAVDWGASNAPHFEAETYGSDTESRILGHSYSPDLAVLDLEREVEEGDSLRRQVVRVSASEYFVIDTAGAREEGNFVVVWTGANSLSSKRSAGSNSFMLQRGDTGDLLMISVESAQAANIEQYLGDVQPFRGWTTQSGTPMPAPAIEVRVPTTSWMLTSFIFPAPGGSPVAAVTSMIEWQDPEHWVVALPGDRQIRRAGSDFTLLPAAGAESAKTVELDVAAYANIETARAGIVAAFDEETAEYPRFKPLVKYRTRATLLIVFLFVLQEIVCALALRRWTPAIATQLRLAGLAGWGAVAGWLAMVYLV